MPKSREKFGGVLLWFLVLFSYVPLLTIYSFMNQPRVYMYAVSFFWFFVFIIYKIFPDIKIPQIRKSREILYFITGGIFIASVVLLILNFSLSINLDPRLVPSLRIWYRYVSDNFIFYIFEYAGNIVNPFLFFLFIKKKKIIPAFLVAFVQVLFFSATGVRTFLFTIPFAVYLILFAKKKNALFYCSIGLILLLLASMISFVVFNDLWISAIFTKRTLFASSKLSFFYYDFFSQNQKVYLSHHRIFRNFLDYPYDISPPRLIARTYFGSEEMNANNGIYADAYMNFGFPGFVVWGAVFILIIKLIDFFSKKRDISLLVSLFAIQILNIKETPFLTLFLTHGLLLSILLIYLVPEEENKNRKEKKDKFVGKWVFSKNTDLSMVGRSSDKKHDFDIISEDILQKLDIKKSDFVLDIGAGNGLITEKIGKKAGKVYGIDFSEFLIKRARKLKKSKNTEYLSGDAFNIDRIFEENYFDKIYSVAFFQLIQKNRAEDLIKKMIYVLNPGGKILVADTPDLRKKWNYYDSFIKRVSYFKQKILRKISGQEGETSVGWWWNPEEIRKICRKLGLKCRIFSQKKNLPHWFYKFDFLIIKNEEK
jgi:ubiquinone/menaquinone biosynthesis C-methylase UbiE